MTLPLCIVTGVGPGTGRAIVERFATEYRVAMLARTVDRLDEIAAANENAFAYPCNVLDEATLADVIARIKSDLGDSEVLVHNAVGGAFGDFLSVKPETLLRNFQINTMTLLHLGQALAPAMIAAGKGAIISTGNTSAYRGKGFFSAFAPTKAAQRILSESMARTLGPKGVHVGYVAIDAVISLEWTRAQNPERPDDYYCYPVDIAEHVWYVAHQPRSAWTFDTIIRPFGENW
jgi:NAD(P)-dependent dehydrogenase (short-subunit alcohol dehydrogenase family)